MLNLTDDKGRAVWVADHRGDFKQSCEELHRNGETFRIYPKRIRVLGGVVKVWVMVLNPQATTPETIAALYRKIEARAAKGG